MTEVAYAQMHYPNWWVEVHPPLLDNPRAPLVTSVAVLGWEAMPECCASAAWRIKMDWGETSTGV